MAGTDYLLRAGEGVPEKGVYIRPHVHLEHEIMWYAVEGKKIIITEVYSDGSSSSNSYPLKQLQ